LHELNSAFYAGVESAGLLMKVLIFSPPPPKRVEGIKSFGAVWAYYLPSELEKLGAEVVRLDSLRPTPEMMAKTNRSRTKKQLIQYHEDLDITGIDHILGLGIRYWSFLPAECGEALRKRLGRYQSMAQIHDSTLLDRTPADVTFALKDRSSEYPPGGTDNGFELYQRHTCLVGWAADSELCQPNQPEDELRILVDHPTFTHTSTDVTLSILLNLRELVQKPELWIDRFKTIRIRQFVDNGVVDVDVTGELVVKPYTRKGIPYVEACKEYSQAHIFMVTHSESVGQTVIETATAGALVVAPNGFIAADRLATVRHHQWSRLIPWDKVLPQIDVQASRSVALQNSWTDIAKRMIDYFENFDRAELGWPEPEKPLSSRQ
jgi:hypothetical protein